MRLLERLYAAYEAHDASRAADLYLPSGLHREVATGRVSRGPDEIAGSLAYFFSAFADATWHVEVQIDQGQNAAAAYRLTGTLTGPLGPLEPRGQLLDLRGVHFLHAKDDRIASLDDYWDALSFQRQMSQAREVGQGRK
jgi:steroid delta-isomerase-like uncharacterized protein